MNGVPPFGGRKGLLRYPIRMGRVSEDAARLSTSADRDALRPALMAFGRKYLHALDSHPEATNSFRMGGWRSHPGSRDIFVPLDLPFATFDFPQWDEYRAMEALFTDRPVLRRLMTEPMYAPTDPVPEFQGLMFGVVAISVERYHVIHGSDEQDFAQLIDELTDWFCRDADPMFVATPVMGFTAPEPLMLAPDITVRRATDEEVSAMLEIGALNLGWRQNPTQVYTIQVPEAARWIVAMDHSRRRRFGSNDKRRTSPISRGLKKQPVRG
jgi:hypothetical protein